MHTIYDSTPAWNILVFSICQSFCSNHTLITDFSCMVTYGQITFPDFYYSVQCHGLATSIPPVLSTNYTSMLTRWSGVTQEPSFSSKDCCRLYWFLVAAGMPSLYNAIVRTDILDCWSLYPLCLLFLGVETPQKHPNAQYFLFFSSLTLRCFASVGHVTVKPMLFYRGTSL